MAQRINSRRKGTAGELEVAGLIRQHLGETRRNLDQARDGGADLEFEGYLFEVKRKETLMLNPWWDKLLKTAAKKGKKPILAYRTNRKPWVFRMRLADVHPDFDHQGGWYTIDCGAEEAFAIIRNSLASEGLS